MAIERCWDIQGDTNWWLSLGFHIDHTDPSITLHLPGCILAVGRLKQPGFKYSLYRPFELADGGLLTLDEAIESNKQNVSHETPD